MIFLAYVSYKSLRKCYAGARWVRVCRGDWVYFVLVWKVRCLEVGTWGPVRIRYGLVQDPGTARSRRWVRYCLVTNCLVVESDPYGYWSLVWPDGVVYGIFLKRIGV